FILAFQALPLILVISALSKLLYHWGPTPDRGSGRPARSTRDYPCTNLGMAGICRVAGAAFARGARHMIGGLVDVTGRDGLAEGGPYAVVVNAGGHHENQHVVAVELPRGHHLNLHGRLRRPVSILADGPSIHLLGHVAERGDLAGRRSAVPGGMVPRR